jgi:predicted AlkP superfamily phosphohydrolase/phosphomutase
MIVIGLDCAPPELVFERYREVMPNVSAMMERGTWGPLRSSEPPITVPAWTCMVSGRDAGELGLYGFRNRVRGSTELRLATAEDVRVKRVWDWLGEQGVRVASLFVPLTSPPSPVFGHMVSGFLYPGGDVPWCYPRSLEGEIESRFGRYLADVDDFRSDDLERVYRDIESMTRQHFAIAKWVWEDKQPDFLMMVEIGVDRFHHAFWRHIDPDHPRHAPGNPHERLGREYYALLDEQIGELRRAAGNDTAVVVVSDHGARAMRGGFCINEWLVREGFLALETKPERSTPLREAGIDWSRTRAWAEGGYYARVFLNVEGREPNGIVPTTRVRETRDAIREALGAVRADDGAKIDAQVRVPEETYRQVRGFPPDLMVYFDDLALRAIGAVGTGRLVVEENDTGPDTCNHAWNGIYLHDGPHPLPIPKTLTDLPNTLLPHFTRGQATPRKRI